MNFLNALPVSDSRPTAADESVCHRPGWALARRGCDCAGYEEHLPDPVSLRMLPSSRVTLTIGFGDPLTGTRPPGNGSGETSATLVVGLRDRADEIVLSGVQQGVVLRCDPLLAYSLGVPLHLVSRSESCADAFLGRDSVRIAERLSEATNWNTRFSALESTLTARLATGPRPDPAVMWTWYRLRTHTGPLRMETLAQHVGWSRRHLARKFQQQIGVAPKTAARIFRFERARALLTDGSPNLAAAAIDSGYSDQAHLSREIRSLTGWSPTELASELRSPTPA